MSERFALHFVCFNRKFYIKIIFYILILCEEGEIDVDGLILLNQSRVTVPLACDQDNGRRREACT